jgi:hypothetical protein
MPLQDHFRPPLSVRRHWHAFHNSWATYISSHLNEHLPEGYFAEANVQFGIEIDVATFEAGGAGLPAEPMGSWTPPAPTQTVPFSIATDNVEILVFSRDGGPTLAGAIELVSPANKDRAVHRDAFVSKCAAYLQQGIGLAVVDVVTDRKANLHTSLLTRLHVPEELSLQTDLYAIAYRPVERDGEPRLDIWEKELEVGRTLPTVPLWLRGALCLPIDLEATYERTCREQRVMANGE